MVTVVGNVGREIKADSDVKMRRIYTKREIDELLIACGKYHEEKPVQLLAAELITLP